MDLLRGFPPLARSDARVLVLGSMPGDASLRAAEYYGHPRNAFWWIMQELYAVPMTAPYAERCELLMDCGVAVWDVLAACQREGSLDAAIQSASEQPNDFASFFLQHQQIRTVFWNGAKAEQAWRKHVAPILTTPMPGNRLPSTSPAHASLSKEEKRDAWRLLTSA
jgi:hypoxanthine-DNA glycosylase